MRSVFEVKVGDRVWLDGQGWDVAELTGTHVRLSAGSSLRVVSITSLAEAAPALIGDTDDEARSEDEAEDRWEVPGVLLASLTARQHQQLLDRLQELRRISEPDPGDRRTMLERYDEAAAETGVARRTLQRQMARLAASVRDQLSIDQQLAFRTGHPLPRYPATTSPDNRRRLQLPAHRPHWPEPDPTRIPQALWWNAVPAVLADHAHSALVRSLLAMALAKTGSTRAWTTIADHLQLPANHAHRIDRLIRHLARHGSWPAVLAALERLMTGLQQHPPPINYPARRAVGHNLGLLTAAVEAGRQRHPTTVPTETLQRRLWERLTGGDIAYAALPIRIDYTDPDYRTFRRLHGVRESDLFHVAHHHLQKATGLDGPLAWRPQLLPDLPTAGSGQPPPPTSPG